jgi:predicted hydrolase (HD superfamily)
MKYNEALKILYDLTKTDSLRKHAHTVETIMRALARKYGEDEEKFAVVGLLHDADYEQFPEKHPGVIVEKLESMGEHEIAHAIKGHYTIWNVPRNSLLDKCIVAADELSGFIVAASLVRPNGFEGMTAKSVRKKLKTKSFAAKVDREEVRKGADLLGMELNELIEFIIEVLQQNREKLDL